MQRRRTYQKRPRAKQSNVRVIARKEAKKVVESQIESKYYDGQLAAVQVDYSTGYVASITENPAGGSSIVQSVTEFGYIGKVISPTHLTVRGYASVGDATNFLRVMLVQDRTNGIPTIPNLLQGATIYSVISPLDRTYDDTYRVLYDKLYTLTDVNTPVKAFKIKISGKKLARMFFSDASGTVERGGIYLALVSDSAAVSHPLVTAMWRLFYKDS